MDKKVLAKLAILAKQDPKVAQQLVQQANAISDDELEMVAGGKADANCVFVSCVFTSECLLDSDTRWHCEATSNDTRTPVGS